MYKMNKIDPVLVRDSVASKHFDTLKKINKCFIDKENENYKECSPYAPF